jgi:hypothetical protein
MGAHQREVDSAYLRFITRRRDMRKLALWSVLLCCLPCHLVSADQVGLRNGDHLTGTVVKYDGEHLTFKSEYAGEVKIRWDVVEAITSDGPLYVTSKDGRVLVGPVRTSGGVVEVQTGEGGKVILAREAIHLIRSREDQAAFEAEQARQLRAVWSGSADAGLSATRGNADTLVISLGSQVARTTRAD